jgi:hypothetical protein
MGYRLDGVSGLVNRAGQLLDFVAGGCRTLGSCSECGNRRAQAVAARLGGRFLVSLRTSRARR